MLDQRLQGYVSDCLGKLIVLLLIRFRFDGDRRKFAAIIAKMGANSLDRTCDTGDHGRHRGVIPCQPLTGFDPHSGLEVRRGGRAHLAGQQQGYGGRQGDGGRPGQGCA